MSTDGWQARSPLGLAPKVREREEEKQNRKTGWRRRKRGFSFFPPPPLYSFLSFHFLLSSSSTRRATGIEKRTPRPMKGNSCPPLILPAGVLGRNFVGPLRCYAYGGRQQ